jgi:hypothetical protein
MSNPPQGGSIFYPLSLVVALRSALTGGFTSFLRGTYENSEVVWAHFGGAVFDRILGGRLNTFQRNT